LVNRRIPNGTYGGVRGRGLGAPSYSIILSFLLFGAEVVPCKELVIDSCLEENTVLFRILYSNNRKGFCYVYCYCCLCARRDRDGGR